ncbi:MAG: hypothetical protein KDB22_18750, partial [Planctomycetales bacterium]|nr:hypothetical protein [Planctomycetales bacterium]
RQIFWPGYRPRRILPRRASGSTKTGAYPSADRKSGNLWFLRGLSRKGWKVQRVFLCPHFYWRFT